MQSRILNSIGALLLVLCSAGFADAAAAGAGSTVAIGLGLSVIGIGIGIGLVGNAAMAGIARQPEQAGTLTTNMLIVAGLVEGAGILAFIFCLVFFFLGT